MIRISFNEKPLVDFAKSVGQATLGVGQLKGAYFASFAANAYTIATGSYFNLTNIALTTFAYAFSESVISKNQGLSRREWDQEQLKLLQGVKFNLLTNLVFGVLNLSTLNTIFTLGYALSSNLAVEKE